MLSNTNTNTKPLNNQLSGESHKENLIAKINIWVNSNKPLSDPIYSKIKQALITENLADHFDNQTLKYIIEHCFITVTGNFGIKTKPYIADGIKILGSCLHKFDKTALINQIIPLIKENLSHDLAMPIIEQFINSNEFDITSDLVEHYRPDLSESQLDNIAEWYNKAQIQIIETQTLPTEVIYEMIQQVPLTECSLKLKNILVGLIKDCQNKFNAQHTKILFKVTKDIVDKAHLARLAHNFIKNVYMDNLSELSNDYNYLVNLLNTYSNDIVNNNENEKHIFYEEMLESLINNNRFSKNNLLDILYKINFSTPILSQQIKQKMQDIITEYVNNFTQSHRSYGGFITIELILNIAPDIVDAATYLNLIKQRINHAIQEDLYNTEDYNHTFTVLSTHQELLLTDDAQFYHDTILDMVTNHREVRSIYEVLQRHGDALTNDELYTLYQQEIYSGDVRRYALNEGRDRDLNLEILGIAQEVVHDPIPHENIINGIAFQIHNYADDLESIVFDLIKVMLDETQTKIETFTIEDLNTKFNLITDNSKKLLAHLALDKISTSADYFDKLKANLPIIATFLNNNKLHTNSQQITLEARWSLWLEQSFIEAGSAYDHANTVSCIKGIYERLYTGLRTIHPAMDKLFLYKNISTACDYLDNQMRNSKEQIITNLKSLKIGSTHPEFNDKLKVGYYNYVIKPFLEAAEDNSFGVFEGLPKTKKYITQYLSHNKPQLISKINTKFDQAINNFASIKLNSHSLETLVIKTMNVEPTQASFPEMTDFVIANNQVYYQNETSGVIQQLELTGFNEQFTLENINSHLDSIKNSVRLLNLGFSAQYNKTLEDYIKSQLE